MVEKVRDVMHSKVEFHAPDASLSAIALTMRQRDVGVVPIVDKQRLVGLVTDRDITVRALADSKDISELRAKDVMTRVVDTCQETDTVQAAATIMEKKKVRRLPVLNSDNVLVGMLSLGDVCAAVSHERGGKLLKAVSAHHP
jgi:CBS domain-containing protein